MLKRFLKCCLMFIQVVLHYDSSAKVFFYHDIGKKYTPMGTDEKLFWQHMKALKKFKSGTGSLVCFDDGFRGVWDARDRLLKEGIRPTVFVAVRLVGQPGYLTWDEIRSLQNDYAFTFQCHTWSHQTLVGKMIEESPQEERTEQWYQRELQESRVEISRQLGREVDELCFPAGQYNEELIGRCKRVGYRHVYTCLPGNRMNAFVQSRNLVQDLNVVSFKLALRGGLKVFYRRYRCLHRLPA